MTDALAGWKKSRCSGVGHDCVEVSVRRERVEVRDSKERDGPVLTFTRRQWEAFLASLRG